MAWYAGRNWKREELVSRVGDPLQIAGARGSVLTDGKADGVRALDVETGSGLSFSVLPGRGMDIPFARYKGKSIGFFSGTGITHPGYYAEPGLEWRRSFYAGLLTTCGITQSGAPSVDQGRSFGLHGRVANAAAENLSVEQEWDGDEFLIRLKGTMREAEAMVENLTLTRRIETRLGARGFRLRDVVANRGFEPQPLLLLYHCNFGFPLLGPRARVVGPIRKTVARDEEARKDRGVEECLTFPEPVQGYPGEGFLPYNRHRQPGPDSRGPPEPRTSVRASRWGLSCAGMRRSFPISPSGKCRGRVSMSWAWNPGPLCRLAAERFGRKGPFPRSRARRSTLSQSISR